MVDIATGLWVFHAMFHVVMTWKYGDVLVAILNQNSTVVTAVDWESRLSSGTAAEHRVQVRLNKRTNKFIG